MTILVKDASVWKPAAPYVKDGGIWKPVQQGLVRDAGVWKEFYAAGIPSGTALGTFIEGGYYIGNVTVSSVLYGVVLAPKSGGEWLAQQWKTANSATTGTDSTVDGFANTAAMADASHPAANLCANLSLSGKDDWYLPSKDELYLCWQNRASIPSGQNMAGGYHWASTQVAATPIYAWNTSMTDGSQNSLRNKNSNNPAVRAVRRAPIS